MSYYDLVLLDALLEKFREEHDPENSIDEIRNMHESIIDTCCTIAVSECDRVERTICEQFPDCHRRALPLTDPDARYNLPPTA